MIRNATYLDVPEILFLADKYVIEEVEPTGHHSPVWDADMMAHHLMTCIAGTEGIVLVAVEDGNIIGYFWGITHCLAPWSPVKVASDLLFYIMPERRGSRAALLLLNAYREWAQEQECTEVRLSVASGINMGRTERLYEHLGFSRFASTFNYKP